MVFVGASGVLLLPLVKYQTPHPLPCLLAQVPVCLATCPPADGVACDSVGESSLSAFKVSSTNHPTAWLPACWGELRSSAIGLLLAE